LRRQAYRWAHRVLRVWWFVRRPRTAGVKCLLRDGERVLFVRHAYGHRGHWELPGGGMRRGESPAAAARREMHEELGVDLDAWAEVAVLETAGYHKRTRLHCFEAPLGTATVRLDHGELEEARWAPAHAPPVPLGDDAAAILADVGVSRRPGGP
jgi:8-oxo-dGTP diphosphatase